MATNTNDTDDGTDPDGDPDLATMSRALEGLIRGGRGHGGGLRSSHDGERDLFDALGYPGRLDYGDYRSWYDRGGIAQAIIGKPPAKTWEERPEIRDDGDVGEDETTSFMDDVASLFDADESTNLDRGIRHYLERVDELARIGRYGVLYLGLADAETEDQLAEPVDGAALGSLDDLLYVTPLGEGDAHVSEWDDDVTSRRNGLPELYDLDLANGSDRNTVEVHHTRVIHVAEGVLEDEVHGQPALRPVINRLMDLEKVLGSAAEAYWMVSNPGLALSVDPDLQDVPTDQMDEQVQEYEHNLRRVLKMYGVDVEQLDSQDVDPEATVDSIVKVIAGTIGLPQRKLVGSERGDLASSQDEASFHEVISSRQSKYAEPVILRPLLDRLLDWGMVSDPRGGTYTVEWPDLFQLTSLEKAELLSKQADAVKTLAPMDEPDTLHSLAELREFSPIETDDAAPPRDPDQDVPEDDDQARAQFDQLADGEGVGEIRVDGGTCSRCGAATDAGLCGACRDDADTH